MNSLFPESVEITHSCLFLYKPLNLFRPIGRNQVQLEVIIEGAAMTAMLNSPTCRLILVVLTIPLLMLWSISCSDDGNTVPSSTSAVLLQPGFQVATVADLEYAEGRVADWVKGPRSLSDPEIVEWIVVGDWILDCNDPCIDASLKEIDFSMAMAMFQPQGEASHSHQFTKFAATKVDQKTSGPGQVVQADDLTLEGKINFSPVGLVDITIELVGVSNGNATFFFTLGAGSPFQDRSGGVVTAYR